MSDNKSLCDTCSHMFTCERSDVGISYANHSVCYEYGPVKKRKVKKMNNDLISRDYVEKIISSEFVDLQDGTEEWRTYVNDTCENILNKVHNAPTVEPCYQTTSCLDCKMYDKEKHNCPRFCEVIRSAIEERPQGEWIYGEDDCGQDGWFCSECGFFVPWYYQYYEKDINFIRDYKACPHCLAEMITYTGKDRDTKGGKEE